MRDYRSVIVAASLVVGPLLMSVGDLLHPEERMDPAAQATIVLDNASRWYVAHLLLFVGFVLFIPGFLALTRVVSERRPIAGYASRILLVVGVGTFCAVFVGEMLIGRYAADGAPLAATTALLETFQSGWVLGVLMVGAAAFFASVAIMVTVLVRSRGPLRWLAIALGLGALLILAEIITAQVLLSQIGNLLILVAGVMFAREVLRRDQPSIAT